MPYWKIRNFSRMRYKCCQPLFCSVRKDGTCKGAVHSGFRVAYTFWSECYRVPCFFYAYPGRGFIPTKTEENVPPHPIPELPEGPKSPLYFTALAQYGPDVPAARFCAAGRPFLGRGAGERPHAARSGAAGVIRFSERHIQSRIPDAAGRHCAGSGPWNLAAGAVSALNSS